jgi:tetratricopeptide (TPR) repeat protein
VASGTAFLADREGHLLSNRHVVCPWTEDQSFDRALRELLSLGETPLFTCRHLLWFEGEKAFKKASVLSENTQLQDHFYIENAFRSDGQPSVRIAGVLPEPQGLGQRIRSPLGDDAAVLKIDRVPGSLEPLSLASPKELEKIGNLAPVMVLGFPLSIEAQEDNRVKANATMGHVRRNYPAVIQVNASIHSGNSGGPVIGLDGRVIGIATAVKTSRGLLISSGLSDFGLILPVNRALPLLESVRAGKAAWDGLPDPALPATLKAIETAARRGRWQEAMAAVEAGMKQRRVPSVFYLAGLLYLSQGDIARARAAYRDLASIAAGDALPRFFLSLCDWMQNIPQSSDQRYLLDRTWRSSGEYYGFLARVLEGKLPLEAALRDCEDRNEVVQSHYVVSLIQQRQGNLAAAEQTLREGLLNAKSDDRNALLLQAQLRRIQAQRLGSLKDAGQKQKYELECRQFQERLQSHVQNQEALAKQSDALWQTIRGLDNSDTSDPAILTAALKQKAELFKDLLKLDPEAYYIQWILGFVHAQLGDWAEAGNWLDSYLSRSGREQGSRLAAGLLRAQITYWRAGERPGNEALRSFAQKTSDPWYRNLALCLLGEVPVEQLIRQSEDEPPEKVTLQLALGIQMEQKGEKERGIQHYSEALESYLDNWMEFEYARARIILLRGEK